MSDATNSGEQAPEEPDARVDNAQDASPEQVDPPSGPVSARGHVNQPGDEKAAPAVSVPPEAAVTPAVEPEPVVVTDDEIAAAIARSSSELNASAAGSATIDTASPAESATPVIAAAEAANLATSPAATAAYDAGVTAPTWAPEPTDGVAPQPVAPIFLQRPEPPKKRSNRGFGILIALVGTVVFALLWVGAVALIGLAIAPSGDLLADLLEYFTRQLSGWAPVVAFFVGMVVLIQIINRARWWAYILGGLFVAALVYFAYIGAALLDAQYWERSADELRIFLGTVWLNPFAVVAGILAREVSIWSGAWLAARGRKLRAKNAEAQADYEQQLADAQNQAVAAYAQQGY